MAVDMYESQSVDILVVGGGVFGSLVALELSKKGFSVKLLEKNSSLMTGASLNNQNRLHLGYHYPRDLETARQCQRGFEEFKRRYPNCILGGFDNIYMISAENSKVSMDEYLKFCEQAKLPVDLVELGNFEPPIFNSEGGLYTNEVVYDCQILKELVTDELLQNNVEVKCNAKVDRMKEVSEGFISFFNEERISSKAVVNCTFSNLNSFNKYLGLDGNTLQYELTVVPVIKWRPQEKLVGITVMDGPFFTVLPHGKSGNYLLYHVEHTVTQTVVGDTYPDSWANPKEAVGKDEAKLLCQKMISAAMRWVPDLRHAEYIDFLASVRVVLPYEDATDRRPSIIERLTTDAPFYTVFSGKIDHSIWVSKDLANKLEASLN